MNCAQQGPMRFRELARGMVEFVRVRFGFHGCCTSLLYWAPRSQSGARGFASVRHLLVRVHEDVAQCLPVRPRCCQIQAAIAYVLKHVRAQQHVHICNYSQASTNDFTASLRIFTASFRQVRREVWSAARLTVGRGEHAVT